MSVNVHNDCYKMKILVTSFLKPCISLQHIQHSGTVFIHFLFMFKRFLKSASFATCVDPPAVLAAPS